MQADVLLPIWIPRESISITDKLLHYTAGTTGFVELFLCLHVRLYKVTVPCRLDVAFDHLRLQRTSTSCQEL